MNLLSSLILKTFRKTEFLLLDKLYLNTVNRNVVDK